MEKMKSCILMVVMVVLAVLVDEGWAKQQDRSCVNQLIPCLKYLNGTRNPPDSCCDPLKEVIKSNPKCLCSMITLKGTSDAQKAGINIDEAQQLPGRCGQHVNPIACLSAPPGSKNSMPSSGSTSSVSSKNMIMAAASAILFQSAMSALSRTHI